MVIKAIITVDKLLVVCQLIHMISGFVPSSKLTTLALLNTLVLPFSKHKITSVLQSCSFPLVCDEILQLCLCLKNFLF